MAAAGVDQRARRITSVVLLLGVRGVDRRGRRRAGQPAARDARRSERDARLFPGASRRANALAAAPSADAGRIAADERRSARAGNDAGTAAARHVRPAADASPRLTRAHAHLRDAVAKDQAGGTSGRNDLAGIRGQMSDPLARYIRRSILQKRRRTFVAEAIHRLQLFKTIDRTTRRARHRRRAEKPR